MTSFSFAQVSSDTRIPGVISEISTERANRGVFDYPTRILVIGQKTATGVAEALTPKLVTSDVQAKALFGQGSTLALMCTALLKHKRNIEIRAIAQEDDVAGVAATGSITVATPSTATGALNLYIAGVRVRIHVSSSDTIAEIATALATEINANKDLPVTAAINAETDEQIDLTAKNKGECGNEAYIMTNFFDDEELPQGLTLTIVQMTNGAGNPDIADVIDAVDEEWFTDWLVPYNDDSNFSTLTDELEERFSAGGKKDAHAYLVKRATHSGLVTFGTGKNSPHVSIEGFPADAPTPSYITAADLCMQGAYLSNEHPAKPFKTAKLINTLAPKTRFNTLERELLLQYGISTWEINPAGDVMIERLITTYQKTETGIDSAVYLDITTPKTVSHLRYDLNSFMTVMYFENPKIITSDEVASAGVRDDLVSVKTVEASINARQQLWQERGLTKEMIELRAELDGDDPTRINVLLSPEITSPLMVIANKIAFQR